MEKYELVKDIGSGNFGVARLMRNKETKELVAMKYIDRGLKVPSLHFLPSFLSPQIIQLLHENLPLHSKYHVFYCSNRIVAVRLYCCLLIYIYIFHSSVADWWKCCEGNHKPQITSPSQHNSIQGGDRSLLNYKGWWSKHVWSVSVILKSSYEIAGGFDSYTSRYCYGVCGRWRTLWANLQCRKVQRRWGLITHLDWQQRWDLQCGWSRYV